MKLPILDRMRIRHLKFFFSLSAGLHLVLFYGVTLFFPGYTIDRLPPLKIEISLLPIVAQEKSISSPVPSRQRKIPIKKEEKRPVSPLPPQAEAKVVPVSNPSTENGMPESTSIVEKTAEAPPVIETESNVLSAETEVTLQEDKSEDESKHESEEKGEEKSEEKSAEKSIEKSLESNSSELLSLASLEDPKDGARALSLPVEEIVFTQPRYAEHPVPLYPREARRKGYQGEVVLRAEILSNGQVGWIEVKRSSGHGILDRSALDAVREWKFIPAKRGEKPVPFWVNIPIKFELQ